MPLFFKRPKDVHEHISELQRKKNIPGLIDALGDDSTRPLAKEALKFLWSKEPSALKPLVALLAGKNATLSSAAFDILSVNTRGSGLTKLLLEALQNKSTRNRPKFVRLLSICAEPCTFEPLIGLLHDPDSEVRKAAIDALGTMRDPRAVGPLMDLLNKETIEVQYEILPALGGLNDFCVTDLLISRLRSNDELMRRGAVTGLGKLGDTRAVGALMAALKDKDYYVREKSAEALGGLNDVQSVSPLIESLNDEHWPVRQLVVVSLARLGDSRAVEPLIRVLKKDDNEYVRDEAAKALGQLGDSRAVMPLIAATKDDSRWVRHSAIRSLELLIDLRAWGPLGDCVYDEYESVRQAAKSVREKIKKDISISSLIRSLESSDWHIRMLAAEFLGEKHDPAVVEALIRTLDDQESLVRQQAAKCLSYQEKDPGTIEPLIRAYYKSDSSTKETIEYALSLLEEVCPKCAEGECVDPFVIRNGVAAHSVRELVQLCKEYPEDGLSHFFGKNFAPWFLQLGRTDLALKSLVTTNYAEFMNWLCFLEGIQPDTPTVQGTATISEEFFEELLGELRNYAFWINPSNPATHMECLENQAVSKQNLQALGELANMKGGLTLMQAVGQRILNQNELFASYLSSAWDGIGAWRA
ncbi:MAG TPA: HEAT repeat domain-containing protein [Anaerolineaceae bacterium]|nr:HEAT repeat domain-containing protein [Anaerolineaceae bacterium]